MGVADDENRPESVPEERGDAGGSGVAPGRSTRPGAEKDVVRGDDRERVGPIQEAAPERASLRDRGMIVEVAPDRLAALREEGLVVEVAPDRRAVLREQGIVVEVAPDRLAALREQGLIVEVAPDRRDELRLGDPGEQMPEISPEDPEEWDRRGPLGEVVQEVAPGEFTVDESRPIPEVAPEGRDRGDERDRGW